MLDTVLDTVIWFLGIYLNSAVLEKTMALFCKNYYHYCKCTHYTYTKFCLIEIKVPPEFLGFSFSKLTSTTPKYYKVNFVKFCENVKTL